ncbi:CSC1-like protein RXW8 isoform X3 [Malania oleifera]|uniref:CSC1-like protein RXW8 isoform X3 n=1 Tax=Malania oleifera TaxID=397392 RepID=UPI0025AEB833|nr:CSC1-like protein RXW8 isoform X3 [Malania oleifera]
MNISALLTSAGINIGVCVLLLSLYSVLRKQPGNVSVYFGRRLAQVRTKRSDPFCFDRLVPSPSWIVKAWETSEEEILAVGGMDAVVFLRILVFSIRVFSIAAAVCVFLVLPLNYYGQEMHHKEIPSESLDVFTIGNVKEGSKWLWAHCLALYVISCSACTLLYFEYKSIANMRLAYIAGSPPNPSHFTIAVRAIPLSEEESYSDTVRKFFLNYHASSYLSHQMIYRSGTVQKLMSDAEKMYKMLVSSPINQRCTPSFVRCGLCGGAANSFKILSSEPETVKEKAEFSDFDLNTRDKECAAAFVFFRTRYAALVASQVLQSSNPMLWVTDLAPEPHDVYWSNLCIPYRQLWIRRIAILLATIVFMFLFLIPVTFVQGLTQLEQLQQTFPFLKGILKKTLMSQLVTGYLPSVILMLFLYTVPPTMMLFSAVEGSISRSGRKKSACCKVLYFTIWNVFFVNVLSGSVISQLNVISSPKDIPTQLARAVPTQILNVYISKYESGGQFWPIVHNTTIFSLVLTQIIALGVFGLKRSPVASGFTIPLVIFTLLFNEYCRQRFHPIFKNNAAQVLIEMDRQDEQSGRMEEIHQQLHSAYCQFTLTSHDACGSRRPNHDEDGNRIQDLEDIKPGLTPSMLGRTPLSGIGDVIAWLSLLITFQERNPPK